ncbi:hypothetical protein [Arsenophonus nasoniae]|uniref:Uncharacterized protein n=1 Tax=Arsenophonus nasoniae TaxID=638 RepID=A0A4P7L336_9GAMM|nr:hypothetical protein [Arsenophonus nasoniae]QBY47011.1 hypothetical protein ArsFIN_56220 [Arsenophonus nasoniae]WGM09199.1 hypothetical protein QE258_28050 [Arsenophonus nasoniae]
MKAIEISEGKSLPKENQKNSKKPEMSIDSYRKLIRAQNVAFHMHRHMNTYGLTDEPMPFLPDIFSYVSEDVSDILQEVENLGLVDHFTENTENK